MGGLLFCAQDVLQNVALLQTADEFGPGVQILKALVAAPLGGTAEWLIEPPRKNRQ